MIERSVALALAAWATLNVLFLSELFDGWRRYWRRRRNTLGRLFGCRFCLSVHLGLWPALLWARARGDDAFAGLLEGLAAAALVQMFDDRFPDSTYLPEGADEAPPAGG